MLLDTIRGSFLPFAGTLLASFERINRRVKVEYIPGVMSAVTERRRHFPDLHGSQEGAFARIAAIYRSPTSALHAFPARLRAPHLSLPLLCGWQNGVDHRLPEDRKSTRLNSSH